MKQYIPDVGVRGSGKRTEYGDHHLVLHHFHGAVAQVVDGGQGVALVYQVLAWRTEVGAYVERQQLQTALRCSLEDRQLQDLPV